MRFPSLLTATALALLGCGRSQPAPDHSAWVPRCGPVDRNGR